MVFKDEIICNVCMLKASEDENAVFIKGNKNGKSIDICTNCIPSVIHGSGMIVKSDEEILKDLD